MALSLPVHTRQMIDDTCARNAAMNRTIQWHFGRARVLNSKSLSEASFFESTKEKVGRQKFSFYIIVDTCRYAQCGLVGFAKT